MRNPIRIIHEIVIIESDIESVWEAWTTKEGICSFFAKDCDVDITPGGKYEIYFEPDEEPGKRGAEGTIVMAFQRPFMFSFTWNAPPHLPEVREHFTHVLLNLETVDENKTRLIFRHNGWGEGGQWDDAFHYFEHAWKNIVLPRLQYRFIHGPVDWGNLPKV